MLSKPRIYLYRADWWRCCWQTGQHSWWVIDGCSPKEVYGELLLWLEKRRG